MSKIQQMITDTKSTLNEAENGNKSKPLLAVSIHDVE